MRPRDGILDGVGIVFLLLIGFWAADRLGAATAMIGWGASLTVLALAFGPLSGAHVNPAVSVGMAVRKQLSWKVALIYMACHLIGAMTYFALRVYYETGSFDLSAAESFMVKPPMDLSGKVVMIAFAAELLSVAGFVFLICLGTSEQVKNQYPWAGPFIIGAGLAIAVGVSTSLSGGSVNPARALAPVILAGKWDWIPLTAFVYVLGPVIGAVAGAGLYGWLEKES